MYVHDTFAEEVPPTGFVFGVTFTCEVCVGGGHFELATCLTTKPETCTPKGKEAPCPLPVKVS